MNNLLEIKYLGTLLRSRWTWRLLRIAMLALLLAMIAFGWHQHAIPGVSVRDPLMYSNFTTFNLWVLWLMGMVAVALVFGRAWCTVCPVGWLNGLVSRFGLRRELPQWLQNFVPVTLTLVLLQLLVYFLSIHRYPDYSAVMLSWMLVIAIAGGLIFRRRSFCLLFCPAGAVFSLYARIAPWQLRVKETSVCDGCQDKPCIETGQLWRQASAGNMRLQWRSRQEGCPVALVPAEIEDSVDCTLCMNCAHNCCNDNIQLGFRRWPFDLLGRGLKPSETLFFMVLLGLLTANFSKVYVDLREAIFWLPETLTLALGWGESGFYLLALLWIGLLFPALLLLPGLIVWLVGQITVTSSKQEPQSADNAAAESAPLGSIVELLGKLALPLLPLVLSAHLALVLVKLNAKLGFLPLVLRDTSGVKSYLAINVMQTVSAPGVLLSLDIIKWLVVALLVAGVAVSILAARRISTEGQATPDRAYLVSSIISVVLLVSFYASTVIEWLFVR